MSLTTISNNPMAPASLLKTLADLVHATKQPDTIRHYDPDERPASPVGVGVTIQVREKHTHLRFQAKAYCDPLTPNTCQADIDRYVFQLRYTNQAGDPQDGTQRRTLHVEAKEVFDTGEVDTAHVIFHDLKNPKSFYVQVRARIKDKDHRPSNWSDWCTPVLPTQESEPKPPAPTFVSLTFDRIGKGKHHAFKGNLRFTPKRNWDVPGGDDEDDMARYAWKIQVSEDDGVGWDKLAHGTVEDKDDGEANEDVIVHFRPARRHHKYRAYLRSIDRYNRRGDWAGPYPDTNGKAPSADSAVGTGPDEPTIVVSSPAPRRMRVKITEPARAEDVDRYEVIWQKDTTGSGNWVDVETDHTRSRYDIYRVPKNELTLYHRARVRAEDEDGNQSTQVTSSGVLPGADDISGGLPNPPNQPSNPSLAFDAHGTRHGRFRALVTAGTSTTDGSHDAPEHYRLQLAHAPTDTGADPPAGTKRESKTVDATDTSDDLVQVFRNIPRAHYVWVRERARNSGGASTWTGWVHNSRPIDMSVTDTPVTLTNVTTISNVRRAGIKWQVPEVVGSGGTQIGIPDESVAHVQVQISRTPGFSDIVDDVLCNPGKGTHRYAIPKNDEGLRHYARCRAVSAVGTYGSWQPSSSGSEVKPDTTQVTATPGDGTISKLSQFISTMRPIAIVTSLPGLPNADYPEGSLVFYEAPDEMKLYRNVNSTWTSAISGADLENGSIGADKIAANAILANHIQAGQIDAAKLATTLTFTQFLVLGASGRFYTSQDGNYIIIGDYGEKDKIKFHNSSYGGNSAFQVSQMYYDNYWQGVIDLVGKLTFGGNSFLAGQQGYIHLENIGQAPRPGSGVNIYGAAGKLHAISPDGTDRVL